MPRISELNSPFASPSRKILVSIGPLSLVNITGTEKVDPRSGLTYGRSALILTPLGPYSAAADDVNPIAPNLLELYAALCATPRMPAVLATFTIEPPGMAIRFSSERIQVMSPVRFTAIILSQSFCS